MLDRVQRWVRPRVLLPLAVVTLGLMVWLHFLDAPLRAVGTSPGGIVSLELAASAEQAGDIVEGWRQAKVVACARTNVWVDFLFLLVYSCFLALLALALRRGLRRWMYHEDHDEHSGFDRCCGLQARLLCWMAVGFLVAGLLDLVENVLLLRLLGGSAGPPAHLWAVSKFTLLAIGALLLVIGGLSLALLVQRAFPLLQYLFYCRYPLLFGALLVLLGPLCLTVAAELLRNLFALAPTQMRWATFLALLYAGTTLLSLLNVLRYGRTRFSITAPAPARVVDWILHYWWWLIAAMVAPLILTALVVSKPGLGHCVEIAVGAGSALLFYWVAALIQELFGDPNRARDETLFAGAERSLKVARNMHVDVGAAASRNRWLRRLGDWIERNFPGYLQGGQILPGHLQATLFVGLAMVAYVVGFFWLDPAPGNNASVPALGYVLLILLIFTWVLPGVSFFLDRYLVPVVLVVVAVPTVLNLATRADHYFPILEGDHEGAPIVASFDNSEDTARQAFPAGSPGATEPPIVVVAASGGGIKASLWTATVLTGLQRDLGDPFTRSVRLISTVSGGSAGALFFLDELEERGKMDDAAIDAVLDHAGATSLHGSAWGLAYPDLLRGAAPWFVRLFIDQQRDRGWALEQIWRHHLNHPDRGLAEWSRKVEAGKLPAVIFNATQVESGSHFLLSSLQIDTWHQWGSHGHFERYGGRDVPAATAARLSASFPWVTPISRPDPISPEGEKIAAEGRVSEEVAVQLRRHLADGGYYDNFGVVSVLHWLETVLGKRGESLAGRRVWVILIRASTYDEMDPTAGRGSEQDGWIYSTVGPVLTLLNVRNSTQFSRNKKELELLANRWCAERGVAINNFGFQLEREGPLSWKLTDDEYCRIACGWHDPINRPERRALVEQLAELTGSASDARLDTSWLPERCRQPAKTTAELCEALASTAPERPAPDPDAPSKPSRFQCRPRDS
jgi:hypothetical protein